MADSPQALQSIQELVNALNRLERTVASVFPQGQAITASAGSSASKFLTVVGTDGNVYKIALLLPS
jgi:hypothetical protein